MSTAPLPSVPEQKFRPFPSTRKRVEPGEILLVAERYEDAIPFLEEQYLRYADTEDTARTAEILSNLGICYRIAGRLHDANNAYARAIMKNPNSGVIWGNAALVMTDMGEHDAALMASHNAYQLVRGQSNHDVDFIHTCMLLREGRWLEAWPLWETSRPKFSLRDTLPPEGEMKEWKGVDDEFPVGSRFLVIGEWGFGDAFLNLRYFQHLKEKGAHVTYLSWKRQLPLFESHPWIDQTIPYVNANSGEQPMRLHTSDYDYFVCLMDMPWKMHNSPSTVPLAEGYMTSNYPATLAPTRKRRIGICWQAEEAAYSHRFRSYRNEEIAELQSVDADWYSLQVKDALPWMTPHEPDSWLDTAKLISQLDLVITVDTAVAHLAGAMGKPTWLMLPAGSSWQWLRDRPTSVWYNSMRLWRSEVPDDFLELPAKVARELR